MRTNYAPRRHCTVLSGDCWYFSKCLGNCGKTSIDDIETKINRLETQIKELIAKMKELQEEKA